MVVDRRVLVRLDGDDGSALRLGRSQRHGGRPSVDVGEDGGELPTNRVNDGPTNQPPAEHTLGGRQGERGEDSR